MYEFEQTSHRIVLSQHFTKRLTRYQSHLVRRGSFWHVLTLYCLDLLIQNDEK